MIVGLCNISRFDQRTHEYSDIVWPQDYRQYPVPERQMQEPDSEEPSGKP